MNVERLIDYPHLLGHYLGYFKLTQIHSDWIKKCWMSDTDYVLQAHRNSYKTTACLVVGAIWYLLFNPESTVLIVRKEYEGAASILKAIYKQLESEEMKVLYSELGFKDFAVSDVRKDTLTLPIKKIITKEGSIETTGIGGSITGRHYDKIICDDIITIKDRVSKAEREKTKDFVRELQNIKNPGGTITFTGTPWHREDAFAILPEADKYPIGSIDIPDLTPNIVNDIKLRTTPSLFSANYLLKHIASEDKMFADAKYSEFDRQASGIIGHIDPAYSGTHYTAFTLAELWSGKIIIKGWVWRKSIEELYQVIANIAKEHNCGTIHLETNADKGLSKTGLEKYYRNIFGYSERENKHNKISGYIKRNWPELYFDYDCQPEYLNMVCDYSEGLEPDDAPDSLASIMRIITQRIVNLDNNIEVKEDEAEYRY